jgi:hypothetical protein
VSAVLPANCGTSQELWLRHRASTLHLTSSHHAAILSSHILTGRRGSKIPKDIWGGKKEEHIHVVFIVVYCYVALCYY